MMRIKKIVFIIVILIVNYFLLSLSIKYYKIHQLLEKNDFKYATLVNVEYNPNLTRIPQKTFIVKFINKNYTLYNPVEYWGEVENENDIKVVYSKEYDQVFYFKSGKKIKIEFLSVLSLFIIVLGFSIYMIYKF
jgi:hypothetical protein